MTEIVNSQVADLLTKPFEISVNKKPVSLTEPIVTGLEIKQAAIDQGVSIDLTFRMVRVEADGKRPPVNNADKVDVREFKTFIAIASDDNSYGAVPR